MVASTAHMDSERVEVDETGGLIAASIERN